MSRLQPSLFDGSRMTIEDSISLTEQSLWAYGSMYRHWAVAFSGGKDSSATLTLIAHLIDTGRVQRPETMTVLYADTGLELLPLHHSAMHIMGNLEQHGWNTQVVYPAMDDRFFVYIFGRGVPPPSNTFRWCTPMLKIEPMQAALKAIRDQTGEKFLTITGVRLGESAARDHRLALACGKNGAECGQGWYQETTPESVASTLAPLLHWRVCHVWDWLGLYAPSYGYPTGGIAAIYGQGTEYEEQQSRTGCIACNLASRDVALDRVIRLPKWGYLQPLKRLKPLYAELKKPHNRLRKAGERNSDGNPSSNPHRMGPLTMDARLWGMGQVLEIQAEINASAAQLEMPEISLIAPDEQARIEELITANTWPNRWTGEEPVATVMTDQLYPDGSVQTLLWEAE